MTTSPLRDPKIYGLLGFILVASPALFFFSAGIPGTRITETQIGSNETIVVTETVRMGAFNPFLLNFIIGAAVAAWGCYRSKLLAWVGSLFVLAFSILGIFSIGLLTLPGALLLVAGTVLKTFTKSA